MMNAKVLGLTLLAGLSPLAQAALVTADFKVNISQVFNVQTQAYEPITPLIATGAFDVSSDAVLAVTHDGDTTTTDVVVDPYSYREDLRFESPLPENLPGSLSGFFLSGGVFSTWGFSGFTTDSPTGFVEGVHFYATFLGPAYDHGIPSSYYNFDVTLSRTTAARNGDGSSGYEFTSDRLVSFLQAAQQDGTLVRYTEGYSDAASIGDYPYPVGVEGVQYTDNSAKISGVEIDGVAAVPEWGTGKLTAICVAALALAMRRRKRGQ